MNVADHDAVVEDYAKDVMEPGPGYDEDFICGVGKCLSEVLGHYISLVEVRHTPVCCSGASEAVDSYLGVSADLDFTTMFQPMLGKGIGM